MGVINIKKWIINMGCLAQMSVIILIHFGPKWDRGGIMEEEEARVGAI
jgi:hypothetical protein